MVRVNALGDACPLPVIKTKKALQEMEIGKVEVLVDNDIAVQNIQRYAVSSGCLFDVKEQDGNFIITLEKTVESQGKDCNDIHTEMKTIVVLSSDKMGSGDDELGGILMKGFVFALTQLDDLPDAVILYNTGAKLSVNGAQALPDLLALEKAGVRILTCGTCLNHFGTADCLGVGEVTNMYTILEEMRFADRIIRP